MSTTLPLTKARVIAALLLICIVAPLADAQVDFIADRLRAQPGQNVTFYDLSDVGNPVTWEWNFGDGTGTGELATGDPVTHAYANLGFYDVSLTVGGDGAFQNLVKTSYIEVLNPPFVDFIYAVPETIGDILGFPLPPVLPEGAFIFLDTSVGGPGLDPAKNWVWNFGDGTATQTGQIVAHVFNTEAQTAVFTVTLTVTWADDSQQSFSRTLIITAPAAGDQRNAASISFVDAIAERDGQGILPLQDWMPLFSFEMISAEPANSGNKSGAQTKAILGDIDNDRVISLSNPLTFTITPDRDDLRGDSWFIEQTDILELAFFKENPTKTDGVLEEEDSLVLRFLSDGTVVDNFTGVPFDPREGPIFPAASPNAGVRFAGFNRSGLQYEVWSERGPSAQSPGIIDTYPEFHSILRDDGSGDSWILAVRTSATWRSATELSYFIEGVRIVDGRGEVPLNDQGELVDNYDPAVDAFPFDPSTTYVSYFNVFDTSSGFFDDYVPSQWNAWAWPNRLYTPLQEHIRPRWDVPGGAFENAFDFVTGEWIELRKLHSLEAWVQIAGINVHAANPPNTSDRRFRHGTSAVNDDEVGFREISVIVTDVNGDPFEPQGVNRLNPVEEFDVMTYNNYGFGFSGIVTDRAVGEDFAFNGVWVFHDSNNNGIFDPPIPEANGEGVSFVDYPMLPYEMVIGGGQEDEKTSADGLTTYPIFRNGENGEKLDGNQVLYPPQWEYIPFPPGGGAPWWKLRLELGGGSREGPNLGFVEKVPDANDPIDLNVDPHDNILVDYFVVVRPDSGYQDISTRPGDGVGMTIGADYRVFVEPRRFNPLVIDSAVGGSGSWDGGLYFDAVQVPLGQRDDSPTGAFAFNIWQNDPLWLDHEPWWPERTADRTTAKPTRMGMDVHDLTMTYESNSNYATMSLIGYAYSDVLRSSFYGDFIDDPTVFEAWVDPFGLRQAQFYYPRWLFVPPWNVISGGPADEDSQTFSQHSFESAPFFQPDFDSLPVGPRSLVFPNPPAQPERPTYETWPATIAPDEYPKLSDWPLTNRRARILKQHIDSDSRSTAMLGINLAGANDPVVNRFNRMHLQQLTVAFWGPDFTPDDLTALDLDGEDEESGVLLIEDADSDSVYGGEFGSDAPVPLRNLLWRPEPEPVDLDGDGNADDVDGDGDVDDNDRAWVLRLRPKLAWSVPNKDQGGPVLDSPIRGSLLKGEVEPQVVTPDATAPDLGNTALLGPKREAAPVAKADTAEPVIVEGVEGETYWKKRPQRVYLDAAKAQSKANQLKALSEEGSSGDDLFVVVRTSNEMSRLEPFKVFIPATLPSRPVQDRQAGIQLTPSNIVSHQALSKLHPEEDPIEGWYFHDMMEASISCEVTDFTGSGQSIFLDGTPVPVLGIDASTNRPDLTKATGTDGLGGPLSFVVPGAVWTDGEFVDHYLVDSGFKSFRIVGNTDNRLTLLSGEPADGQWRIVGNPTFLEQVIVELYDEGRDGEFTIQNDLLPLNINQAVSGVAIYRDNDSDPANTNGQFDADVDIPLTLDYPPYLIGAVGEPSTQVMFVFSTPGTDNLPRPMTEQANNRQWVQDAIGTNPEDPDAGADFFIVLRATDRMDLDDDFRVAIVGWGPNTPTEPDPDTFPPPPATDRGEFDIFSEFPWGARALGFITLFNEPDFPDSDMPTSGIPDNSGFNFIRYQANKAVRSAIITASERVIGPTDVVISRASTDRLPQVIPDNGLSFVIYGSGFGNSPVVTLAGITLTVNEAQNTEIEVTIPGGSVIDQDPIVLTVFNPATIKQTSRGDLFILISVPSDADAPKISSVSPNTGTSDDFPVTIFGEDFDDPVVYFGQTFMPVASWTSTRIDVSFPAGGIGQTGTLDVTVRNQTTDLSTTELDAFAYKNLPVAPRPCFIATAAYGTDSADELMVLRTFRDEVLLQSSAGAAFVDMYYRISPSVAETVARRPALAAVVRGILTPVAYAVASPLTAMGVMALLVLGLYAARRRAGAAPTTTM